MNRTTKIWGTITLMVLSTCTHAHAQSYGDSQLDARAHYDGITAGEKSAQIDRQINNDYRIDSLRRDQSDSQYEMQQLETQHMIEAVGRE